MADQYLEAAAAADAAVMEAEPGMLHHTFDASPDDPNLFVWSEVYANDAALGAHLENPAVGTYLEQHFELADDFQVEVYGTLGDATLEVALGLPFPVKVFTTQLGYSRVSA